MTIADVLRDRFQKAAMAALLGLERLQSGVAFNPLDARYRRDPYPLYRRLRERDPRHRSRLGGGWVFSRYGDCADVLRDGRFLVDGRKLPGYGEQRARLVKAGALAADEPDTPSILTLDPPDHTRLRALVSRAFTPRVVEGMRSRVEALVHEHLDAVALEEGFDVMRVLAQPLPVIVIAEMLGVPPADRDQFKRWSDDAIRSLGFASVEDVRVANRAARELTVYFQGIAEERRREPREDLLSALLVAVLIGLIPFLTGTQVFGGSVAELVK